MASIALVPTPTPKPVVAGPDDTVVTLPAMMTILPDSGATDTDVLDAAGGNRLRCRLDGALEVQVVEASDDRRYLRVEGTECDGWVTSEKVSPLE